MKHLFYFQFTVLTLIMIMFSGCKKEYSTKDAVGIGNATMKTANNLHNTSSNPKQNVSILGFIEESILFVGNTIHDRTTYPTTELMAGTWTIGQESFYFRGMYANTSIPRGGKIKSAYLSLYSDPNPWNGDKVHANYGTNNAFYIRRVTGSYDLFNMGALNWFNTPGTVTDAQVLIEHTDAPFLDLIDIDVTQLVRKMSDSLHYSCSFLFIQRNSIGLNARIFCSSTHPITSKRPKLVVNWE